MFPSSSKKLFELKENENTFNELCEKLKTHSFESPWSLCFKDIHKGTEDNSCVVKEFQMPDVDLFVECEANILISDSAENNTNNDEVMDYINEEKFLPLKTFLLKVQDVGQVEHFEDVHLLYSLNSSQVLKLCEYLNNALLNEESINSFLSVILNQEKPLSITTASTFVKNIFPKLFSLKLNNSRYLSISILNFSQVYPKAVIDEVLIPCLKEISIETSLQEILFKLVKSDILKDYIAYMLRSILKEAEPHENTFMFIQILIEKTIPYENTLHDDLALKIEIWNSTNNSNMKFIKLIISILSIYGSELTVLQLQLYTDIIKANKTIMKKAAENVIKKLKHT